MPAYLAAYIERVPRIADRLTGVSLECRDALDLITDYGKHPDVLLYCDPPYLGSTRSANYRHEMLTEADHRTMAAALKACTSSVLLSGYRSPLYDELYAGWYQTELSAWTGNGIRDGRTKADGDRTEVLWCNREPVNPALFGTTA
jgi:DNA adenine methylase